MTFREFLGSFFKKPSKSVSGDVASESGSYEELYTGAINAFAVFAVIDMVASLCAAAELKTYKDGKPFKGLEWHNLNIRPNVNQSATEFWKEAYSKLLYEGKLLVVPIGGQKIIADSFSVDEYALRENVFTGVTRGSFTFNKAFQSSEVFYIQYSNQNVKPIVNDVLSVYSALYSEAANNYIRSGGSKAIIEVDTLPAGDPKLEEEYSKSINKRMREFNRARDATLTLFQGMKYTDLKSSGGGKEIPDIKSIFDGAVTRAAQAFKVPPQLVLGEVSGINDAIDYMLTVCIDPLLNVVSEELSGKEFSPDEYISGSFIAADTTNIKHIDIFSLAPNIEKLISSAFANIDETRERAGLHPTGEDWAQVHFCTKNQEPITNLNIMGDTSGGGEKS